MNDCITVIGNEMTHFDTGAVRDIQENKGRCDLLPLFIVAETYDHWKRNYQKLIDINSCEPFMPLALKKIEYYMETGCHKVIYDTICLFMLYTHNWETNKDGCNSHSSMFTELGQMFLDVSLHFKRGAEKYGERNWNKGIPLHSYIDSAIRHLIKYVANYNDERHDLAFIWNLICCLYTERFINNPSLMDLPFCTKDKQTSNNGMNNILKTI